MKMPVLSVRDTLIGFGTPFTAVNVDVAKRGFSNSIMRALGGDDFDSPNPEDLSLFVVGEFDTVDGTLSPCEPHVVVYGHAIVTEYHNNYSNNSHNNRGDVIEEVK